MFSDDGRGKGKLSSPQRTSSLPRTRSASSSSSPTEDRYLRSRSVARSIAKEVEGLRGQREERDVREDRRRDSR